MTREITKHELRNESGEIMRRLDQGESFIVTRNGVAVGELSPVRRCRFVTTAEALTAFAPAPHLDHERLRADLGAVAGQNPYPRAALAVERPYSPASRRRAAQWRARRPTGKR